LIEDITVQIVQGTQICSSDGSITKVSLYVSLSVIRRYNDAKAFYTVVVRVGVRVRVKD
jgi:hypothetical protein